MPCITAFSLPRAIAIDTRLFELLANPDGNSVPFHCEWNGSAKEKHSTAQSAWAPFPKFMTK